MTDRYAIVPIPDGPPPPEAIVVGGLDEIMQFLPQTVAYHELESRALGLVDQLTQREQAFSDGVRALTPAIDRFMDACSKLVDGEEAQAAEQRREDAEDKARAEAAQLRDWLDAHPEPGASIDNTHQPGGELHALEPPDKEHLDPEGEDDAGGVPLSYGNLPSSYIKGEAEDEPPGIGGATYPEPDPEDLGGPQDPKQVPQPTTVSLW
jgi:hypothetical protein